jgi:hypothetical protein
MGPHHSRALSFSPQPTQRYSHGVLTIKVPLQAPQWRTLDILHLSPNRHLD